MNRFTTSNLSRKRYVAAGDRAYIIGTTDGHFPPLGWHIKGKMGGVWAHPIRLLDKFWFTLDSVRLPPAQKFISGTGYVQMDYPELHLTRTEFAIDGLPVVLVGLTFSSSQSRPIQLTVHVVPDLIASYPWSWSRPKNAKKFNDFPLQSIYEDETLIFTKNACVAMVRGSLPAEQGSNNGVLEYRFPVSDRTTFWLAIAGSHHSFEEANHALKTALQNPDAHLQHRIASRQKLLAMSRIEIPDMLLQETFEWAKMNLADLTMTVKNAQVRDVVQGKKYPEPVAVLPEVRGVVAGLPDFPSFFSTDGAYTGIALAACGQWEVAAAHLRTIRDFSRAINGNTGKAVHEIMTDGSVYYGTNADKGNTNETAQYAIALETLWRWSGDNALIEDLYDFVQDGLKYITTALDRNQNGCPEGSGMVERGGMGKETLDNTVYTWRALHGLVAMAIHCRDAETAAWAAEKAKFIEQHFESRWWMPDKNLYADSTDDCANSRKRHQHLHWINAVPMEMGLASREHGLAALERLSGEDFTGENGLYHTGQRELKVWTLSNAVMAIGALNYGKIEQALHYMYPAARALDVEMPGALPEVLPSPHYNPYDRQQEQYMFMQAWSAYGIITPIVMQIFGIQPDAPRQRLRIIPHLPDGWQKISIQNLKVGDGEIAVTVINSGTQIEIVLHTSLKNWQIAMGTVLPENAAVENVHLNGNPVEYQLQETLRGRELQVSASTTDTLTITICGNCHR